MSEFRPNLPQTEGRTAAEGKIEDLRLGGGVFVEAVRVTRMPMIVTDPALPGNPIVFANAAFLALSGHSMEEVLGQQPHFMDGPGTDPDTVGRFREAIAAGREETLDILQYRKDGGTFWAALFVGPQRDDRGRVVHHFLSFLDITRRCEAEADLRRMAADLERRVEERTRELEAANARLALMIREVDHRAKNSIAIAGALLKMQRGTHADPAVRAAFDEARARLAAMARAHDLLSRSGDPLEASLADYLPELCAAIAASQGSRVRIAAEVEDGIVVGADTAIALGLLVNELVANSLKHAFPGGRAGTVEVGARRMGQGRVRLRVEDDGVGMSGPGNGSLGHLIVGSLVEQIGGEMSVRGDRGVCVTIDFPA